MESETPSQKNKPQAVKRGIAGIKTNAKKLVEDGNVPLVTVYIHPESDKCTFLSDSVSAEALENLDIIAQIENILYKSHKSGKSLKFYDREEVNAEKRQAGQAERNDDSESRTNICHLPKPVYRIIKERALFDFEATRDLLTSALACEGFGRGGKN